MTTVRIEDNEPVNLEHQPEQVEEAAGSERQMSRRNEEEENGEEEEVTQFAFNFFAEARPKRERKLSDEEQNVETKRLKSPGREDAQQEGQHGREGVGQEEEKLERGELCRETLKRAGDEASIEGVAVILRAQRAHQVSLPLGDVPGPKQTICQCCCRRREQWSLVT